MCGRDGKRGRKCKGERDERVGEKESVCERGESVRREREGGRGIVCERKESERGRECG